MSLDVIFRSGQDADFLDIMANIIREVHKNSSSLNELTIPLTKTSDKINVQ